MLEKGDLVTIMEEDSNLVYEVVEFTGSLVLLRDSVNPNILKKVNINQVNILPVEW